MFKNIREYENLHIALWLVKDACWVGSYRLAGMLMIVPTLAVAVHIMWRSRRQISDLFHNIAVCLWISANAIWMTGEFFFDDGLRGYAIPLFWTGIVTVVFYYAFRFIKSAMAKKAALEEMKEEPVAYESR